VEAGETTGGYRLEAVIGRGGMGVVYRATQLSLGREVALKILQPEIARDETFRQRFIREARIAATIDHPNAITVYETGELDGSLFISMRYVEGPDLGRVIAESGPLDAKRAADIISQVASALDAAHERGLVHRDIKPANILIGSGDHAYLTDFGIAKHHIESEGMTQSGQIVGSVDFMAPEQISGGAVDARADQYALGAVLYSALVGRPPYVRDSDIQTLFAHMNDPPPSVTADRPELPEQFDDVIARAMAKAPAERYATAGELAGAALAAAAGSALPAPLAIAAPELGTLSPTPFPDAATGLGPGPAAWPGVGAPASPSLESAPPPPASWQSPPTIPPTAPGYPGYGETAPPPPPWSNTQPPFEPSWAPDTPPSAPGPSRGRHRWLPRFRFPRLRWRRREAEAPRPEYRQTPAEPAARLPSMPSGVRFMLHPEFSFVHHPLTADEPLIPLLGNDSAIEALAQRIEHSRGGSFLITGFRGVGKSTVVLRAIHQVDDEVAGTVVHVNLNVARPREPTELMFEVIRRLFEALDDGRALGRLSPELHDQLLLAYQRTLLTFKHTRGDGRERSGGISLDMGGLPIGPKVDLGGKSSQSLAVETSFLGYTEGDVEQDFVRIVRMLRDDPGARSDAGEPPVGKVIVVFDELDKLTDTDGVSQIDPLLRSLKNLFTTANVHFIFVAGPDLHDAALLESHRGNSVYDSVFAWQLYIPCVWNAAEDLLRATVLDPHSDPSTFQEFSHYLRFKARGVPRLLLKELNGFVTWYRDQACLELRGPDLARVYFYAWIDRILDDFVRPGGAVPTFGVAIDADRWMIGAYYLTDAILGTGGESFTAASLLKAGAGRGVEAVSVDSERKVTALLDYFATHSVLQVVHGKDASSTFYGDTPDAQTLVYRLSDDVVAKLSAFARIDERERADLASTSASANPWGDTDAPGSVVGDRYELLEELDRGGMGRVYRARDRQAGTSVAVKLLDVPELVASAPMRARFERKAQIALEVDHPNVVRTLDILSEGGVPGIVMALVPGTPLRQLIDQVRIGPRDAVHIAMHLLDALVYLFERGIIRCDLKPSGIMVDASLTPVILDLGIAKRVQSDAPPAEAIVATQVGVAVGTPAYAAPEQLAGKAVDVRGDIFSLAAILFEMVSGRPPRGEGDMFEILARAAREDIVVDDLAVSPEFKVVLRTALARDPEARYRTPAAMRDALARTPEVQGAVGVEA
jgi:serine/threonine protein kinase